MSINFAPNNAAELSTTTTFAWSNICDIAADSVNQTYSGLLTIIARQENGTSASWNKLIVLERTGSTLRNVGGSLIDLVAPVKDLGALLWDVRVNITGTNFQIQCKGGSLSDPVAWFIDGNIRGLLDAP